MFAEPAFAYSGLLCVMRPLSCLQVLPTLFHPRGASCYITFLLCFFFVTGNIIVFIIARIFFPSVDYAVAM